MKVRHTPVTGRRDFLKLLAASLPLASLPLTQRAFAADGKKPRVGIIGSGNVGGSLGRVLANAGYPVMFASRSLANDTKLAADVGANARAGSPQEAAAFGDVLIFAVPYGALPELGKTLGGALRGKPVIDACNPFPERDGPIATQAREKGVGIMSAELLPGALIVRAFNAVPAARMGSVHETPGSVGMPMAGDDKRALEIATQLVRDIGFDPVVIGGLDKGRYLMPGTPLAGEHTAQELRKLAAKL